MYKKISAINSEWNRKHNFTIEESYGFYIKEKNGQAHFAWHFPKHKLKFFKCEDSVFSKSFRFENEEIKFDIEKQEGIVFEGYPFKFRCIVFSKCDF